MKIDRAKLSGLIGALLTLLLVVSVLLWVHLTQPLGDEESGVPVMMGDALTSITGGGVTNLTEVKQLPQKIDEPESNAPEKTVPKAAPEVLKPLVSGEEESPMQVKNKKEKSPIKANTVVVKKKVTPKKDLPSPEEIERKRKETEAAENRQRIVNAFGKGKEKIAGHEGETSTTAAPIGSSKGESENGKKTGSAGYGTFDLGGRSIGQGGLPVPRYNVQEEGKVVVSIIVDPEGRVISTRIHPSTNTVNLSLRDAALSAARLARFNRVGGLDDQSGTITYNFKLK